MKVRLSSLVPFALSATPFLLSTSLQIYHRDLTKYVHIFKSEVLSLERFLCAWLVLRG